jgi:hypothetical protein
MLVLRSLFALCRSRERPADGPNTLLDQGSMLFNQVLTPAKDYSFVSASRYTGDQSCLFSAKYAKHFKRFEE